MSKTPKKDNRNPVAKSLAKIKPKVVPSAKGYKRKSKHPTKAQNGENSA